MAKLLALAFALNLDTFLGSVALGTLGLGQSAKRNLILLFSFCDGVASLAGSLLAVRFLRDDHFWFARFQASALCLYALLIVAFGWYARTTRQRHRNANLFYALPFLLCLDNLATGLSLSLPGMPASVFAVIVGIASLLMALAGLKAGSMVRRHSPIRLVTLAGAALLCLVAVMSLR